MTAGGEIFHWYNGQTVHVNQSVTLDSGTVFEQTKSYTASRGTVHDVANTIVINSNTSASYDLGMGILFEDTRGQVGHYSADFRDPYITLTYNDTVFQLDETIQEQITEDLGLIENSFFTFKVLNIVETQELITETFNEPVLENFNNETLPEPELITEQVFEQTATIEEEPEQIAEQINEETTEEIKEEIVEQKEEVAKEPQEDKQEVATEPKEEEPKEEVAEETPKKEVKTKVANAKTNKKPKIDKVMAKVDAQIKDHAKNLVIKNIIKLDAMQNDQASLVGYNNAIFYPPKDIYLNQIEIFDNRSIYKNVDLVKYIDNDIMEIKIKKLNEIKYKKRILLLELKELKNG
jgi:chemotaxis protein histidine kinase CheA